MTNEFRSYDDAKKFLMPLKLKNYEEWIEYCESGRKPVDIPANPWDIYKKEWCGVLAFVNKHTSPCVDKGYRTHMEARKFVSRLKLKNHDEWVEYCKSGKKPKGIPHNPEKIYETEGWFGWDYWFSIGKPSYRSFDDAKKFIQSLHLKNTKEWKEFCKSGKKPSDIPSRPQEIYKKSVEKTNEERIQKF